MTETNREVAIVLTVLMAALVIVALVIVAILSLVANSNILLVLFTVGGLVLIYNGIYKLLECLFGCIDAD